MPHLDLTSSALAPGVSTVRVHYRDAGGDLYDGRLGELRVPTLVIHGARDPRTEPGELEGMRAALTHGARSAATSVGAAAGCDRPRRVAALRQCVILPEGGHRPHSERATADDVTQIASELLTELPVAQGFSQANP